MELGWLKVCVDWEFGLLFLKYPEPYTAEANYTSLLVRMGRQRLGNACPSGIPDSQCPAMRIFI